MQDELRANGTSGFYFLSQFPLGGLFQGLSLVHAAGRNLPAVVLRLDVAVLAHKQHVILVHKGHDAHAIAKGDHAIDRRLPIGHLGHVLAQAHPGILID